MSVSRSAEISVILSVDDSSKSQHLLELVAFQDLAKALVASMPKGGILLEMSPLLGVGSPTGLVHARMSVSSISFLQELGGLVLTGDLEKAITEALPAGKPSVSVHRWRFAAAYEVCARALCSLTPHQQEMVSRISATESARVEAPAGAGKTFVAVHRIVECLLRGASVLVVVQNCALCFWIASLIGSRLQDVSKYLAVLARLSFAYPPFDGLQKIDIEGRSFKLSAAASPPKEPFGLVVVDGAEHIYSNEAWRWKVEAWTSASKDTALLLLSDASAKVELGEVPYPPNLKEVKLLQVLRSSKQILSHTMPFQLGGEERKASIACGHDSAGPLVQSFIWGKEEKDRYQRYADETALAVQSASRVLKEDVSLSGRLAVLVPDDAFLASLQPLLGAALGKLFPDRVFELQSAASALANGLPGTQVLGAEGASSPQRVVVDTVQNFGGLEQLVVVAVGLDAKIEEGSSLQTRSRIYRATSRATLMLCIVNELVEGGFMDWLEKLDSKDPKPDVESILVNRQVDRAPDVGAPGAPPKEMPGVGKVIAFEVEGEKYHAAIIRTRSSDEDPEHGTTHEIRYQPPTVGTEWVKIQDGYLSDTYGHCDIQITVTDDVPVEEVTVKEEVCNECGKTKELGYTDPADGKWYCKDCWDAFEAMEDGNPA